MRITPLDIQQKLFPVKFRGFHAEEVSSFLELIREEIEDLLRENASFKEVIQKSDEEIRRFRDMQDLLGRTLQEAHQTADEYKIHSRREADTLIEKAGERAAEMIAKAHEQALAINEEIAELKMIRKRFHEDMRGTLGRFLQIIPEEEGNSIPVSPHLLPETGGSGEEAEERVPSEGADEALLSEEQEGIVEGHPGKEKGAQT
jgi:cell division initiation protein